MNKNRQETIEHAKQYVYSILHNDSSGHDYYHVLRVYEMALVLSKEQDVDLFVISMAALLHDLDDYKISDVGSKRVEQYLNNQNISEKDIIIDIIDNMSFHSHKEGRIVNTLEGQIVQDADRLDALGAIGIARVFAYSGVKNRPIYNNDLDDDSSIAHFYQKLLLLPDLMNTTEAKIIAKERVAFMELYLNTFFAEWKV